MELEAWKPIKDYEGLYEVSNLGRVKSTRKILKPRDTPNGYYHVGLYKDKKRTEHYIHRLVAQAFLDNANGYREVNHIDENKKNNKVSNLEWCGRAYNVSYSAYKLRKPHNYPKQGKTGHKYISVNASGSYRVRYRTLKVDKTFDTLEQAQAFLSEVLKNGV